MQQQMATACCDLQDAMVSYKLPPMQINERLATNGASENPEASTIGVDSSVYTSDGEQDTCAKQCRVHDCMGHVP